MQYRIDPKTGNRLSALGFGCMRLPSGQDRIDALLMQAIDSGVNYFDTAYVYVGSEAALGQTLEKHGARERVFLATKLPIMLCRAYADFDKFLDIQLKRLRTDYIDYYFMHMLSSPAQWQRLLDMGIARWLDEKRAQGKIRQVGFSYHGSGKDFAPLLDAYPWDFCQIQYNYMNINYQAGRAGLHYAAQKGLPVFIMEPLLGGKLANALPKEASALLAKADPASSPAAWALRWVWNEPGVTVVLSGMNTPEQLTENLATAEAALPGSLTPAERQTIDEVVALFDTAHRIPCTGCNYCMPCPQGISIPTCFTAYNTSYAISRFAGMQQYTTGTGAASSSPAGASKCIQCGKCAKSCPQHIPIPEKMREVAGRMEPFWYRAGVAVVSRFLRGRGKKTTNE